MRLSHIPGNPYIRLDIPYEEYAGKLKPYMPFWICSLRKIAMDPDCVGQILTWAVDTDAGVLEQLRHDLATKPLADVLYMLEEHEVAFRTTWQPAIHLKNPINPLFRIPAGFASFIDEASTRGWLFRFKAYPIRTALGRAYEISFAMTELELWHSEYCQGIFIDCTTGAITDTSLSVAEESIRCGLELYISQLGRRVYVSDIPCDMTLEWAFTDALVATWYNQTLGTYALSPWVQTNLPIGAIIGCPINLVDGKLTMTLHPTPAETLSYFRKAGGFSTQLRAGGVMLEPAPHLIQSGAEGLVLLTGHNRKTRKDAPLRRFFNPEEASKMSEHLNIDNEQRILKASRILNDYLDWYVLERDIVKDAERRQRRAGTLDDHTARVTSRWSFQPFASMNNRVQVSYRLLKEVPHA